MFYSMYIGEPGFETNLSIMPQCEYKKKKN